MKQAVDISYQYTEYIVSLCSPSVRFAAISLTSAQYEIVCLEWSHSLQHRNGQLVQPSPRTIYTSQQLTLCRRALHKSGSDNSC